MGKLTDEQKKLITEYGHLFNNTGGNDVIELVEREDINFPTTQLFAFCK